MTANRAILEVDSAQAAFTDEPVGAAELRTEPTQVRIRDLVDAFVLDRDLALRGRLSDHGFELLCGPYGRVVGGLRAGDLLVRASVGEGQARVARLVDGDLLSPLEAERRGWELEGTLPGRYALVTADRWARRITDRRGDIPPGQAIVRPHYGIRLRAGSGGEIFAEDEPAATVLRSARFAGDEVLVAVAQGRLRLAAPGTAPIPAPVSSTGPAVTKVQQALIDLGYPLPRFGADGRFGAELGAAVTKFKSDWHIQPGDPVIGRLTLAALDNEVLAHDRPRPPPPTPTPPTPPTPPLDPFGRRPSGLAKVSPALAAVTAFGSTGAGSNWLHLDRTTVATGIAERVTNPDGAQQGGNGLCTTAAFINIWAQDAPDAYAAFATTLFDRGAATLGPTQNGAGLRIRASNALLGADYPTIAKRMATKGFPVPSPADWMVFSAIRDSTNTLFNFTGDPDDWVSHTLGDGASPVGDLDTWLRSAGAWTSVVNNANVLFTASLADAKKLDPTRSRCLLSIDVGMLLAHQSGGHTVVLRSPVTQASDGSVRLRVWTWAGVRDVQVSRQKFEGTYKGANIAFL